VGPVPPAFAGLAGLEKSSRRLRPGTYCQCLTGQAEPSPQPVRTTVPSAAASQPSGFVVRLQAINRAIQPEVGNVRGLPRSATAPAALDSAVAPWAHAYRRADSFRYCVNLAGGGNRLKFANGFAELPEHIARGVKITASCDAVLVAALVQMAFLAEMLP
jgi:hypothetical protein